ncbi:putative uncharacterized protein [Tetragenococcus halophilus subsp. halophilus]|uniref:Uncharacterized protein n=5 Tax=Tetragenococcus TaxID=51668 RepID=A0A2H6DN36_TETHA|nr:hypothetical protein TEH_04530 [Tetragenococcus halophilus NBRC 12172]GBD59050.1 putative uncharacterized protein [Tetragenococcus halophilus subsp. halophilus]GBD63346.1 putative uncharacterized protein [Tetragenococcus halophilus subsp. flandriensis]GEQ41063.1 hypothetical protein TH5N_19410 [Tetragenococcus halophilus]GMA44341.1 hypothetical protein GCM10025853_17980 [Tetragenococcus halophilus subsp. halophilus DSM 20339]GMA52891.1 hypothetical protein GCM10025857_42480 [Alicyclobacillu
MGELTSLVTLDYFGVTMYNQIREVISMLKTKTRAQGRSIVVTLPAEDGATVFPGKEYLVSYGNDGTIVLIPKIEDPFANVTEGAFYESDVWEDMPAVGKEVLDD